MSADVIFQTVRNILGKMRITFQEKLYVGTFIVSVLFLRTFSIAGLSLMFAGENLKTERNKAYEFLKKKFSHTEIFRLIVSELPYKKTYIFLLSLIIHGYVIKGLYSHLFLIKKEQFRLLSV
jgi:hypothetical protein